MVFSLRSYQEEAVTDLLDSILRGETSGVTALVTGGGKSVILAEAVRRVRTMWNGRILVLTHVAELVTQDVAAIAKLNTPFDVGVNCSALNRRDTQHPIVVATIGSIAKNLDALGVRHLVLIDEAHRVSPTEQTQYNQVIRHFRALTPKMYTWGLTATPYRQGQGLLTEGDGALFDHIITDMTVGDKFTWFIDQGYLVDVKSVRTETEIDVAEVSVSNSGEFNQKELQQVTDQHEITRKILLEAEPHIVAARACMIFAVGVSHAWHVHALLAELLGIHAVVVVGDTVTKERNEAFRLFKTGTVKVLINCGVATTGFDYNAVDLLVVIRAIRSTSLWVQIVGRALRPVYAPGYDLSTQEGRLAAIEHSPKGRYSKVLDFGGNAMRLGEVNAPAIPSNKKKKRDPNAPNEPPPAKSCPMCQAVMASNVRECRFCGFEFPITTLHEHADGSDIIKREADKAEAPVLPKPKGSRIHHTVYSTVYSVHVAKNGQSQLRAVYTTGRGTVAEFFSFATEAKAEGRLQAWWRKVTPPKTAVPKTAREAVDFLTGGTVESIAFVVTQLKGDYNNVVGHFHTREALDAFMGEPTSE